MNIEKIADRLITDKTARIHFVGIGGVGISALADLRALMGGVVSGSDRSFDTGIALGQRDLFIARGMTIFPQDGSGVHGAAAIVASVAVEDDVPDMAAARAAGIPIIRRTQWIAAHTRAMASISVTGTAGKSTTTAMIFEILRAGGLDPSLLTGADLRVLLSQGLSGNAYLGTGPLVIEADESDRGIMEYTPDVSVILNLGHDHDTPARILEIFHALADAAARGTVLSDDDGLAPLQASGRKVFGPHAQDAAHRVTDIIDTPNDVSFRYGGHLVRLNMPGVYNVMNAAAALSTGLLYGLKVPDMVATLAKFKGVARRFEVVGSSKQVEVIDDYAANTMKIEAAIRTAQRRRSHIVAYIQPVGFGPMRMMRADLTRMLADVMRAGDDLVFAPIPYFGGTVVKDISSDDLIADIRALAPHIKIHLAKSRDDFISDVRQKTFNDTTILIMGARDPTLSDFAHQVAQAVA